MKILLLSPLPPPFGGIASWTLNVTRNHLPKYYGLKIIHQDTALKYRSILTDNIFSRIFYGIFEIRRIIIELKRNIVLSSPDVIHLTSCGSLALIKDIILFRIIRKKDIPLVLHWHFGRIPFLAKKNNWEWSLLKYLIRRTCCSVVIDLKSFAVLRAARFKNIVYIPNPIGGELEHISRNFPQRNGKPYNRSLVFVGHVIKEKGVFELVKAVSKIPGIQILKFIGPYKSSVKDELIKIAGRKSKTQQIQFLGPLNNQQVLEEIRNSSIFVLPSYTEGFPIVVLEAMSMACPVIATEVGAIPEMLAVPSDNPCGICVPPGNVEKLRQAIQSLTDNPKMAFQMGESGRLRVLEDYTCKSVLHQLVTVWKNAVFDKTNPSNVKT